MLTDGRTDDGRTDDGRTTDAGVTGILIAHLGAFGLGELKNMLNLPSITLENHCTRATQSSRGGCSRRVHKIEYLAVDKGNILVIFNGRFSRRSNIILDLNYSPIRSIFKL